MSNSVRLLGLCFLFVFGLLFSIQFLTMLVHRTSTLSHYLARASYKFGKPMHSNWSFNDKVGTDIRTSTHTCTHAHVFKLVLQ